MRPTTYPATERINTSTPPSRQITTTTTTISPSHPSTVTNTIFTSRNLGIAAGIALAGVTATLVYQLYRNTSGVSSSSISSLSNRPSRLRDLVMSSVHSSPSQSHPTGSSFTKKPIVVTVTGAAGQIGYSIIFMIAGGKMLGADQPIELRLLDMSEKIQIKTA